VHPQLGPLEIGGWDRMNFWRNPPPSLREREAARFPAWLTQLALSLPKLEILQATCEAVGHDGPGDTWRVRLAVGNAGYLPAYVTRRARERQVVRGTVFEITLQDGATLVTGKAREVGAHLEGRAPRSSLQAFLPDRDVTADRTLQEWIVRGPRGSVVTVEARADRAGMVRAQIALG
jgi:hypothetical protein